MSGYIKLGSRTAQGQPDPTGKNMGNWTVVLDPGTVQINVPYFECYKIVVSGAPFSVFNVGIGPNMWDTSQFGQANSWEPGGESALPLTPGDTVYFYYSDPITDNTPPTVTMWFRYDPEFLTNKTVSIPGVR